MKIISPLLPIVAIIVARDAVVVATPITFSSAFSLLRLSGTTIFHIPLYHILAVSFGAGHSSVYIYMYAYFSSRDSHSLRPS